MMKKLFLLLISLLFIFLLMSCHGSEKKVAFEIPDEFDTDKKYEIVFWAKNENNATQREVYNQAIERFESIYPNIDVTIKHYTSYDDIYNDVITNIQTNTTPNVCITYPDHIATYISGENVVVPLNDLIKDRRFGLGGKEILFDAPSEDDMVEKFMDECYIGDRLYAVPFMRSTEACYINKTYVEALGYEVPDILTWDFIFEVSNAALEKDASGNYKVNGQKELIPFIYKSTDNMMIQMLAQQNAGYSTVKGEIKIFDDPATKEILLTIAENAKSGAFSTFSISSYPANFLNKGQCIFAIDSTAGSTWMGSDAPLSDVHHGSLVEFETVVRPIPQYNPEEPKMISQGPSLCIFNKDDTGEVLASWIFVQYLLSNETQIAYSQTEGYLPVTKKAQNSPEYQDYLSRSGEDNELHYSIKLDSVKLLMDNTENTFTTPVFNGSTSLRNASGEMIEDVCKAVNRRKKVNSKYIDRLYQDMIKLYRLDQIGEFEGKIRIKEIPTGSIVLLSGIGATWLAIGGFVLVNYLKKRKKLKVIKYIDNK